MSKLMLDPYRYLLPLEEPTIKLRKKPHRIKRWDDPVIGSSVTYRTESLRRWTAEQETPAQKPQPARRRPAGPRMAG
jgi:hypothetical protein